MKKPLCSVQDAQQCYLYNSGEWEISVRTLVPRFFASVAQLEDGRAFVFEWVDTHATGSCCAFQSFNKDFFPPTNRDDSSEIYDPATNSFSPGPDLPYNTSSSCALEVPGQPGDGVIIMCLLFPQYYATN